MLASHVQPTTIRDTMIGHLAVFPRPFWWTRTFGVVPTQAACPVMKTCDACTGKTFVTTVGVHANRVCGTYVWTTTFVDIVRTMFPSETSSTDTYSLVDSVHTRSAVIAGRRRTPIRCGCRCGGSWGCGRRVITPDVDIVNSNNADIVEFSVFENNLKCIK